MTDLEFPAAVNELLEERGMSQRELTRRAQTATDSNFPHLSTINQVMVGSVSPSMALIEAVAKGFNISPTHFAEYR